MMRTLTATRRRLAAAVGLAAAAGAAAAATTYADLAPLLQARCVVCHAGEGAPLGLRLDSLDGLLKGSRNGPVVRAGDAAGSELIRRLKGVSQPRMPMTGPPWLEAADIARFEAWVAGGLAAGSAAATTGPGVAATGGAAAGVAAPARPRPGEAVTYAHVAPIFATRCAKCHTDNGLMGPPPEGYRLTSHAATLSPADRVRVVPGNPAASELLRRIKGQARPRMPFDGPPWLGDEEIGLIEAWIAQGARDAAGKPAPLPTGARLRLHGRLDAAGGLDGLALAVDGGTRFDKSPRPGDYVELRGRLDAAGQVLVERLRRR